MPTVNTVSRSNLIRVLREHGVSDQVIAEAFDITRQRLHAMLGPRTSKPGPKPKPEPPPSLPPLPKDLPAALRTWRRHRKITLNEAAARIGTNRQTWHNWETGRTGCSLPRLLLGYLNMIDRSETTAKPVTSANNRKIISENDSDVLTSTL
jgi:helix-turn-helix protein